MPSVVQPPGARSYDSRLSGSKPSSGSALDDSPNTPDHRRTWAPAPILHCPVEPVCAADNTQPRCRSPTKHALTIEGEEADPYGGRYDDVVRNRRFFVHSGGIEFG